MLQEKDTRNSARGVENIPFFILPWTEGNVSQFIFWGKKWEQENNDGT